MFYFRIEEFCSVLCIFGKTLLHDFNWPIFPALFLHPIIPKIMSADMKPDRKKLNNDHDVYTWAFTKIV